MKRLIQYSVFALCAILSNSVFAHHSSAPHFDQDKTVEVVGVITKIRMVNPHSYLYFDVTQGGEKVNWRCELTSATQMKRSGWSSTMFVPGEKISVTGSPARREDNVCYMKTITFANGTTVNRYGDLNKPQDAVAAETETKVKREKRLANGQPNFTGPWVTKSFGRNGEGIRPRWVASEAGKAAVGGYEMAYDDPILRCHIVNIIGGWNHDQQVNDITQTDELVTLKYGFMDFVRTIHLGVSEHPPEITPSTGGHSIGRWDADILVVDTIGFEAGVLEHRNGSKHSDQMHIVERFYFDEDRQYLVRDYTVEDPLYLAGVVKGQDFMALSDEPYTAYNCVELSGKNNIRPQSESAIEPSSEPESRENPEDEPEDKPWWKFWD